MYDGEDIWVSGRLVLALVDGLGAHKEVGLSILAANGLPNPAENGWYSQKAWLGALQEIKNDVGPNTLFVIGKKIPEKIFIPTEESEEETIERALARINLVYHLQHKKGEQILYDEDADKIFEGAGGIKYERIAQNQARLTCENPYPEEINKGFIVKVARMYDPLVEIADDEKPNAFIVTWNN